MLEYTAFTATTLDIFKFGTCEMEFSKVYDKRKRSTHFFVGGMEVNNHTLLTHSINKDYFKELGIFYDPNFKKFWLPKMETIYRDWATFSSDNGILYSPTGGFIVGFCRSYRPLIYDDDLDVVIPHKHAYIFEELLRNHPKGRRISINGNEYFLARHYANELKEKWYFMRPYLHQESEVDYHTFIDIFVCKTYNCNFNLLNPGKRCFTEEYKLRQIQSICLFDRPHTGSFTAFYGPYNFHTSDDFPLVDFCGIKIRIPKILLSNPVYGCKKWSEGTYGYDVRKRVHPEKKSNILLHRNLYKYYFEFMNQNSCKIS